MIFQDTALAGLFEVHTDTRTDGRGGFTRLHCERELAEVAPGCRVVQANLSQTRQRGTLRGLHFQTGDAADGKLIRCLRGRVFDVAVDLRPTSPTWGQWRSMELAAGQPCQVWIPPGFAHGFQTLSDDVELLYLHTAFHSPGHEAGLRYDDPRLGITWPLPVTQVSPRDLAWPAMSAMPMPTRDSAEVT